MRDIRSDLHERAKATEEEVRSIVGDYEKKIGQLQTERDEKVAKATMKLEMITKLIEFENADMDKAPPVAPRAALMPLSQVVVPLHNESGAPLTSLAQAIGFKKVG